MGICMGVHPASNSYDSHCRPFPFLMGEGVAAPLERRTGPNQAACFSSTDDPPPDRRGATPTAPFSPSRIWAGQTVASSLPHRRVLLVSRESAGMQPAFTSACAAAAVLDGVSRSQGPLNPKAFRLLGLRPVCPEVDALGAEVGDFLARPGGAFEYVLLPRDLEAFKSGGHDRGLERCLQQRPGYSVGP